MKINTDGRLIISKAERKTLEALLSNSARLRAQVAEAQAQTMMAEASIAESNARIAEAEVRIATAEAKTAELREREVDALARIDVTRCVYDQMRAQAREFSEALRLEWMQDRCFSCWCGDD